VTRFSRTEEKTARSRQLRRDMTNAEWRLWGVLRGSQFGVSFRRQHPIGPHFADFYCASLKLVIELDGGQHAEREAADAARTAFMEARGIAVVRYWNNEVMENLDSVCSDLAAAIQRRRFELGIDPLSSSPLQGEE
jgi:very-short-patch-repair endonuclease